MQKDSVPQLDQPAAARSASKASTTIGSITREPRKHRVDYLPDLPRLGTFFLFLRASERPIAIACLRLVTVLPLLPLLSAPRLRSRIARSTSFPAPREYRRAMCEVLSLGR